MWKILLLDHLMWPPFEVMELWCQLQFPITKRKRLHTLPTYSILSKVSKWQNAKRIKQDFVLPKAFHSLYVISICTSNFPKYKRMHYHKCTTLFLLSLSIHYYACGYRLSLNHAIDNLLTSHKEQPMQQGFVYKEQLRNWYRILMDVN